MSTRKQRLEQHFADHMGRLSWQLTHIKEELGRPGFDLREQSNRSAMRLHALLLSQAALDLLGTLGHIDDFYFDGDRKRLRDPFQLPSPDRLMREGLEPEVDAESLKGESDLELEEKEGLGLGDETDGGEEGR